MQLFDDTQRTYMGYKEPHESMYAFLNRSARPAYERVRNVLDMWYQDIPETFRDTLRTSFRSGDQQHLGAFFEIYCHTLLKKQDFSVSPQEVVDRTHGNPVDFLVLASNAPLFYLEATVAMESEETVKSQHHLHQLWEALNSLTEPLFRIKIEVKQLSSHSLPTTQICNELHQWLQSLDPDEIARDRRTPVMIRGLPVFGTVMGGTLSSLLSLDLLSRGVKPGKRSCIKSHPGNGTAHKIRYAAHSSQKQINMELSSFLISLQ